MCKLLIGNETDDNFVIEILGRSYPDSKDFEDGNWLGAKIHISIGPFKGVVNASLRAEEFSRFLKQVEPMAKTLKGTAEYRSMEKWLSINMSCDKFGHVRAEGIIKEGPVTHTQLNYVINFDQTQFKHILNALNEIGTKFPVLR